MPFVRKNEGLTLSTEHDLQYSVADLNDIDYKIEFHDVDFGNLYYEVMDLSEFRGDPSTNNQVIQLNPVEANDAENHNDAPAEQNGFENRRWFDWVQYGRSLRERYAHLFQ